MATRRKTGRRRGQSAAFLKQIRKKFGLGEYSKGPKKPKRRAPTRRRRRSVVPAALPGGFLRP